MHDYKVEVKRDGRWWMIHVPEIAGLTQARRVSEIEEMARSLIALSTDRPLTEVKVQVVRITVPEVGDILGTARHIEELRCKAAEAEAAAATAVQQYAKELAHKGIPVRDAAELLGVSPQRVSQVTNAS